MIAANPHLPLAEVSTHSRPKAAVTHSRPKAAVKIPVYQQ
ncbi:hypothetical protein l11_12900 [Neisseria weaveri LMG 5135]|nr:hypothetical protein l11_12900 [Neisseria weaveri LMG 5135]